MEGSRIFVKGLPPNYGLEEFKKHFSRFAGVSDAKLISNRQIGYVGYRSYHEAAKAVKYFNKSFIRMSRIGVEFARSVEEERTQISSDRGKPQKSLSLIAEKSGHNSQRKDLKRKHGDTDPKLQEFLEVMQPPSRSKTWANESPSKAQAPTSDIPEGIIKNGEELGGGEDYVRLPKKHKRSEESRPVENNLSIEQKEGVPKRLRSSANDALKKESPGEESSERSPMKSKKRSDTATLPENDSKVSKDISIHQHGSKDVKFAVQKSLDPKDISDPPDTAPVAASDADWLRSRTSRLLGLADDDSIEITPAPHHSNSEREVDKFNDAQDLNQDQDSDVSSPINGPIQEHRSGEGDSDLEVKDLHSDTGRLYTRNLPYETTGDELRAYFESFGDLLEVHVPLDRSGSGKGFAFIQFDLSSAANSARLALDGKPFQGRLLHVLPAPPRKDHSLDEFAISKLPIKKQRQIKRKAQAASSTFSWNSMYMDIDAVMSSVSDRLGVPKSELLDPTSPNTAVKQAHAETHIIQETKAYFAAEGINLDAFKRREKSDTSILIKNFPYGTKTDELRNLFGTYGTIAQILLPPSGTIAIVNFELAKDARSAFSALAYRKFKDSVLFLEKAPKELFAQSKSAPRKDPGILAKQANPKPSTTDLLEGEPTQEHINSSTLFVRNLNFSTSTERLRELFQPLDGFLSARVKTKTNPKKPGSLLSMGFGFVEFRSKDQAYSALAAIDGYDLDGHKIVLKMSSKALDASEEGKKQDQARKIAGRRTKIIIKNLPFEASKKDVHSLFGSYGQLRSVRMPKKFDSSTRGFAFADFVTAREAENAMDALRDTHFLGRRLVLDFAAEDTIDPEQEIEKMQKKVGRQANTVALQRLTSAGRKKFAVNGNDIQDD